MNASNSRKSAQTHIALLLLPVLFAGCSGEIGGSDDAGGGSGTGGGNVPRANTDSAAMDEDSAVTLDVLANDVAVVDALDVTSVIIVQAPVNGIASVNGATGEVDYAPDQDFHGVDSFAYQVASVGGVNGAQYSNIATVDIEVNGVNDAPEIGAIADQLCEEVACAATVVQGENQVAINPALYASDLDSDLDETAGLAFNGQTVSIVALPTNGDVSVDQVSGLITYTPDMGFVGVDAYQWVIADSGPDAPTPLSSAPASVTITVTPNAAPTAQNLELSLLETGCASANIGGEHSAEINFAALWADSDGIIQADTLALVGPDFGALVLNPSGTYTYTPAEGFFGADAIAWSVQDDDCEVAAAVVSITVTQNQAPVASSSTASVDENGCASLNEVTIDPQALVADADGTIDMSTLVLGTSPIGGALSLNPDGTIKYVPAVGFSGADSFGWMVVDDDCDTSNEATVSITVTPNQAPVAVSSTASVDENGCPALDNEVTVDLAALVADSDGTIDMGALALSTPAVGGTATLNGDGTISYVPAEGFSGTDSFGWTVVDDDCALSNEAMVSISVTPNLAPVVADAVLKVDEVGCATTPVGDEHSAVLETEILASDADGTIDMSTFVVSTPPSKGEVVENGDGTITYTPDFGEVGTDSFSWTIQDDDCDSGTGTVWVAIHTNTIPTAINTSRTVDENGCGAATAENITVIDTTLLISDADGAVDFTTLQVQVTSGPTSGTADVNTTTGEITYTPDVGFFGADSFRWTADDDDCDPNDPGALVEIEVLENQAPVAQDVAVSVDENGCGAATAENITVIDLSALISDADGTVDFSTLVAETSLDGLVEENVPGLGQITYTPEVGFFGTEFITWTVEDDDCDRNDPGALVEIEVLENQAPVAQGVADTVNEGGSIQIAFDATDSDGVVENEDLTVNVIVTQPIDASGNPLGTVTVVDADGGGDGPWVMQWDPADACGEADDLMGTITWTYTVSDDDCDDSNSVTVTLDILPDPDGPEVSNEEVTTNKNIPIIIAVLANDVPGGGWDTDGDCVDDSWEPLELIDIATVTILSTGTGSVEVNDGLVTYLPDLNDTGLGVDTFTYEVSDEAGHVSNVGTVTVTVEDANTAPTANADVYSITEDDPATSFDVIVNDTDIDSTGPASVWCSEVFISTPPTHGTVIIAGVTIEYTVDGNFCGVDSFEYYIQDTDGIFGPSSSNTTSVTITVSPVNDQPEVTLTNLEALKNAGQIGILNTVATETFFFDLSEGVNVGGEWDSGGEFDCGDAIVAYEFFLDPVTGSDAGPVRGQATTLDAVTGQMTYVPNQNLGDGNGAPILGTSTNLNDGDFDQDLFSYRAQDASGLWSDPIQVTITIRDRNTPPRGVVDAATTDEDTAVEIDSIGGSTAGANADFQGDRCGIGGLGNVQSEFCAAIDSTTLAVVAQPLNGTVEVFDNDPDPLVVENWFRYTPDPDFNGVDSFTYHVADAYVDVLGDPAPLFSDDGTSWTMTPVDMQPTVVQVTVDPVNDIPTGQDAGFACAEIGCGLTVIGGEHEIIVDPADHASDIDSGLDFTSVVVTSAPAKGSAIVDPVSGRMTYTPNIGVVGDDAWGWTITDLDGSTSAEITVSVDILPNMAPVSFATPSLSLREDPCATGAVDHVGTVDVGALASSSQITDADGSLDLSITGVSITSAPAWGAASYDPGTQLITYVVNSTHAGGSDPFAFTVSDDDCDASNEIWVSVTVTPNEAPTLDNQALLMDEGGSLLITLTGDDADGSLDFSTLVITPPAEGTLTDNGDGTLSYDAADECGDTDFFGSVSFTVSVNDDDCTSSNTATIDITVAPVNDAPTVTADSYLYSQGSPLETPGWATPAFGATMAAANLFDNDTELGGGFASNASCVVDSGDVDAGDAWSAGPISIFFSGIPEIPDAVDGDIHTYIFASPGTGTGVLNVDVMTGEFQLWPGTDLQTDQGDPLNGTGANLDDLSWQCFSDTISFGYKRFDQGYAGDQSDALESNLAAVVVGLDGASANDCPVSTDDVAGVAKNDFTDIDMSANDFDTDGSIDSLSIVILSLPAHASSLQDNGDGTWRYEPDENFIGTDTFAYAVQDLDGLWTAAAMVTVTVTDRNTPPTANADAGAVAEEGSVTIDVLANDVDIDDPLDPTTFIVPSTTTIVVAASAGVAVNNGDGTITLDILGAGLITGNTVTLTYEVTDGGYLTFDPATSNQGTVTVTVIAPLASMAGGNPQASAKGNSGAGLGTLGGPGGQGNIKPLQPAKPVQPGPKQPAFPNGGPKAQVVNGALYYVANVSPDEERDALFRMDQSSVVTVFVAAEEGGHIYDFTVDPLGRAVLLRGDVVRDGEISLLLVNLGSGEAKTLDTGAPETGDVLEFRVTQSWRQVLYLSSGKAGLRRGVIELGLKTNRIDELKETR